MCGRFVSRTEAAMERSWDLIRPPVPFESYNVAPTRSVPVIRVGENGRECVLARWGLIPTWAKDRAIGYKTFNARLETAASKPVFRAAFKRRRCVFPVVGFYEWRRAGKSKQPMFIHAASGAQLALAGLWDRWVDASSGEVVESAAILTTAANAFMRAIHDRMPVILSDAQIAPWLARAEVQVGDTAGDGHDEEPGADVLCLGPCAEEMLAAYPVSARVNNARNDDPSNIEPLLADPASV
ncbi:MAG: SOS response-associated peptidase [Gammaproteobacteria bacterium]|nr:SOS response-associated peptidase [Gammaproteobacteria bacterium]